MILKKKEREIGVILVQDECKSSSYTTSYIMTEWQMGGCKIIIMNCIPIFSHALMTF